MSSTALFLKPAHEWWREAICDLPIMARTRVPISTNPFLEAMAMYRLIPRCLLPPLSRNPMPSRVARSLVMPSEYLPRRLGRPFLSLEAMRLLLTIIGLPPALGTLFLAGLAHDDSQCLRAPAVQEPSPGKASQPPSDIHETSARPVREPNSDPTRPASFEIQTPSARGDRNQASGGKANSVPKPIPAVPPVRRPTLAQRSAALRAGHTSVPTIFDRNLLPEVGPIGDIRSDQIRGLIARGVRGASFLLRLLQYGEPPQPMKIREYLSDKIVQKEWEASEKIDVKSVLGEGILLEPDGKLSFIKRSA